jgi:hypothetical protein
MNNNARKRLIGCIVAVGATAGLPAQTPDLFSAFEMGGRALGMGGGIYSNSSDVSATYWNPAGLGNIQKGLAELNFRNRPGSNTSLSGRFDDPERDTSAVFGSNAITFGGVAIPIGGGVLGFSYATGGFIRDVGFGGNLTNPDNPGQVIATDDFLKVQNDFFTIAYGTKSGGTNIGVGVVIGRQSISNRIFSIDQNSNVLEDVDVSGEGTGFGGIVGVQFTPGASQNVSIGFSYRSEIKLNGLDNVSAYSDAIPARLQGGIAWRTDGFRGGKDYLIGGIDAMYFFSASEGKLLERDSQISAGLGMEYNWSQSFGYIPIRAGFRLTDAGGRLFTQRDAFTFGVGYRPKTEDFTIDLNMAAGNGQSRPDITLSASFAIGK